MQPITLNLIAAPAAARPRARSTLVAGLIVLAVSLLMPNAGNAQDARVRKIDGGLEGRHGEIGSAEN